MTYFIEIIYLRQTFFPLTYESQRESSLWIETIREVIAKKRRRQQRFRCLRLLAKD